MSNQPKSLFLLGSTGYIGGALLVALQKAYPSAKITALARPSSLKTPSPYPHAQPSLGAALLSSGASEVIPGSHSDLDLVEDISARVDVVINAADSDDLPFTNAILRGMERRAKAIRERVVTDAGIEKPILIHTSGTGLLTDEPNGEFTPYAEKIWNDNEENDIRSIPDTALHRNVDNAIFASMRSNLINAYILAPSCIYGTGTGPGRRTSIQIPSLINAALRRRQTVMIGKGTNRWDAVHVLDLIDLYLLIFQLALKNEETASPYARFYFGSTDSYEWAPVIKTLAGILYKKGLVDNDQVQSLKSVDEEKQIGVTAHNSRSYAERAFNLGWKPSRPALVETLEEDVDEFLKTYKK